MRKRKSMGPKNNQELLAEITELRTRLEEAQEPLQAIRNGEVDALIVATPDGDRVFTLKGAETSYRIIVESINEGAATLTEGGILLYANTCLAEMLKLPMPQLMGSSLFNRTVPTHHARLKTLLRKGLRQNARGEISLITGSGATLPVHVSLRRLPEEKATRLCAVITDISRQKEAAKILEKKVRQRTAELQKAKELNEYQLAQLNGIFTQMTEGIAIFDPNGYLLSMNPAALEIHGFSSLEQTRQNLHELGELFELSDEKGRLLPVEEWPISRAIRGETIKSYVARVRRSDTGRSWYASYGAVPILDQRGRMLLAIVTLRDITGLKIAEQEREHLIENLEKAVKELEGFTYSVSHDLRAPIRHLSSYAHLLRQSINTSLDPKNREYLNIIVEAARKLGILVDELLEFTRMDRTALSKTRINLDTLVGDIVRDYKEENQGRSIDWRLLPLPEVFGDQAMLHLVFGNLISNAVKFTSRRRKAVIEVGCAGSEENHIIYVKDNGIGFDMRYYNKLFGVFHRLHTSEEFEGTGIGLANAQRIVERHGGRIWGVGEIDKGAAFYVSLPGVMPVKAQKPHRSHR